MSVFAKILIAFLISDFISAFMAAFTKVAYKNKFSSQLSNYENGVKNGTISLIDRIKLFFINFIAGIFAPPVYFKAFIILVIMLLF